MMLLALALAVSAPELPPDLVLDLGQGVQLRAVLIKPGVFTQGSPDDEAGREADEVPRTVTLSHSYYIGVAPVRRIDYERFVADSGYKTEAEKGSSGGNGVENGKLVQKKEYTWRNPGFAQTER